MKIALLKQNTQIDIYREKLKTLLLKRNYLHLTGQPISTTESIFQLRLAPF